MGRNGKNPSAFDYMTRLISLNVGNILTSEQLLNGKEPSCRNVETNYLYKFIKLGYLEIIGSGSKVTCKDTTYRVLKAFPTGYNSSVFTDELKLFNGKPARYEESLRILRGR